METVTKFILQEKAETVSNIHNSVDFFQNTENYRKLTELPNLHGLEASIR